jgi:hypothetical protein
MLKDNPKVTVIAIVCIFIAIITFSYLFLTQWQVPKSAADGVTAATRGDYEKAVKIWYALAKQGDGPSKQNLYDLLRDAAEEIGKRDYKQAAEMLRPLAAKGYGASISLSRTLNSDVNRTVASELRSKINWFRKAKAAAAKSPAELPFGPLIGPDEIGHDEMNEAQQFKNYLANTTVTTELLLELTEFLIQEDNKTFTPKGRTGD